MSVDPRSEKNIETLKPEVQELARELIRRAAEQGICAKVIDGSRSYEEQNKLYAQGRTKPGKIVTKARGGQSWHNFGLAFDVGIFDPSGEHYYGESRAYNELGRIGKELGLQWGGDWDFEDPPHFQLNTKGYSLAEIRARHEAGEDLFT